MKTCSECKRENCGFRGEKNDYSDGCNKNDETPDNKCGDCCYLSYDLGCMFYEVNHE